MSEAPTPGRLLLVTSRGDTDPRPLARAVAARLDRAVHVDLPALADLVVSGGVATQPPDPRAVEQLYLRWLAGIAAAETYQRAGYDAVLSEQVDGDLLDDLLDFVDPTPVHLVVLGGGRPAVPPAGPPPVTRAVRPGGLHLDLASRPASEPVEPTELNELDELVELVEAVLLHLADDEAVVDPDALR